MSRDDPISGRRGDSGVLYSFIYKYAIQIQKKITLIERIYKSL